MFRATHRATVYTLPDLALRFIDLELVGREYRDGTGAVVARIGDGDVTYWLGSPSAARWTIRARPGRKPRAGSTGKRQWITVKLRSGRRVTVAVTEEERLAFTAAARRAGAGTGSGNETAESTRIAPERQS